MNLAAGIFGSLGILLGTILTSFAGATNESGPPAPPRELKVIPRPLRVDLNWTKAEARTAYDVQRAQKPGGPFESLPPEIPGLNFYTDFIGTPGGDYYFRVRSCRTEDTNRPPVTSDWSQVR